MRSQGLGRTKQDQLEAARAGRFSKGGTRSADSIDGGPRAYEAFKMQSKSAASAAAPSRITKGATGQGPGYVNNAPRVRRPVPSMNPSAAGRWPTRS